MKEKSILLATWQIFNILVNKLLQERALVVSYLLDSINLLLKCNNFLIDNIAFKQWISYQMFSIHWSELILSNLFKNIVFCNFGAL